MLEGKVLRGKFEGYFFTEQDIPILSGQYLPDSEKFVVNLYSGELKDAEIMIEYNPETYLEKDGLLLHNIKNISVERSAAAKIRESITLGFVQVVLRDVAVLRSWEKEGRTYGILTADFIGKVQQKKVFDDNIDPNENDSNHDKKINPDINNDKKTDPYHDDNGGGSILPFNRKGCLPGANLFQSFSSGGCLPRIWEFLKWILLFGLILYLLDQCQGCNSGNNNERNCCAEADSLKDELDSLKSKTEKYRRDKTESEEKSEKLRKEKEIEESRADSLEEENRVLKLKKKIGDFSEELYFYGDTDDLREYSEKEINKIVAKLNLYPNLRVEVEGYVNGTYPKIPDLDKRRAFRVKQLLVSKGISADRIKASGKGSKSVVNKDELFTDENGMQYNRNMRAIIKIYE
jgi:outer membrane protein OmpA-like peptidoglycan-associated protein